MSAGEPIWEEVIVEAKQRSVDIKEAALQRVMYEKGPSRAAILSGVRMWRPPRTQSRYVLVGEID